MEKQKRPDASFCSLERLVIDLQEIKAKSKGKGVLHPFRIDRASLGIAEVPTGRLEPFDRDAARAGDEAGHVPNLEVAPDEFHRFELWCVGRQDFQVQASKVRAQGTDKRPFVVAASVPSDDDSSAQVLRAARVGNPPRSRCQCSSLRVRGRIASPVLAVMPR